MDGCGAVSEKHKAAPRGAAVETRVCRTHHSRTAEGRYLTEAPTLIYGGPLPDILALRSVPGANFRNAAASRSLQSDSSFNSMLDVMAVLDKGARGSAGTATKWKKTWGKSVPGVLYRFRPIVYGTHVIICERPGVKNDLAKKQLVPD
jgi:hypothetical protein